MLDLRKHWPNAVTVEEILNQLQALSDDGYGDMPVFHGTHNKSWIPSVQFIEETRIGSVGCINLPSLGWSGIEFKKGRKERDPTYGGYYGIPTEEHEREQTEGVSYSSGWKLCTKCNCRVPQ